jgi:hypothetical protein
MKNKLILFICLIALPLIAHTQKQSKDFSNSKALDSLSIERRLVVLGVKSLDYYVHLNDINSRIIRTQSEVIVYNEGYIRQLEGLNKGLNEGLNEELNRKKKWRKATLYSVGLNVLFIAGTYLYLSL